MMLYFHTTICNHKMRVITIQPQNCKQIIRNDIVVSRKQSSFLSHILWFSNANNTDIIMTRFDPFHSVENIVVEVTFHFWKILGNFLAIFGQFLGNFWVILLKNEVFNNYSKSEQFLIQKKTHFYAK